MPTDTPYFDLQVNGYAGVEFNDENLTAEGLHTACERLRRDGTAAFLATIITAPMPFMCNCLRRLVGLRQGDPLAQEMIPGFHIEGPFISALDGYRGAHPKNGVRKPDIDSAEQLLEAAGGLARIVTLAPECDDGLRVTRMLAQRGIVVSGGHCNPTLDQLRAAVDAGMSMCTHVGNGCPMQMHRHDNIIQRVLSLSDRLWLCFIADGVHVPVVALGNYLKCAGLDRCIVVTDAITPAGCGPGRYQLGEWDVVIGEDMAAMAPDGSHFLGSAITMPRSVQNLIQKIGLTPAQANKLTAVNPRLAVKIQ